MNMQKLVVSVLLFVGVIAVRAEDVSFSASAPNAVPNGQPFQLVYSVNSSAKDLRIPEISDFDIIAGPFQSKSSSTQIVNGNISSSTTVRYTYTLLPKNEGTFSISPATIIVDKQKYTSNALTIKVLPAEEDVQPQQNSSQSQGQVSSSQSITNENLFLRTIVSRSNVYEQEVVLVTYKIYTRVDLVNITNVKFPDFKGFLMQEIDLPKDKQFSLENYNGRNYNTITLRQILLYPQHSGEIDIEKMTCDAIVRVRNVSSRPRSIFDDFFDSYQEVQKPLVAPSKTIEVTPLPSAKPASFSGAVGSLKMSSSISKTEMSANESVTIKLKISGNGNLKLIKNPEVKFPSDFEVYEPKVENNFSNTTAGVSGTKTIEYLAIPRFGGTYTIPSIKFSYFDINEKKYITLSSEEYTLNVQKSNNEASGEQSVVISNFSNKENVKMLGNDIRHIYTNEINIQPSKKLYFGPLLFWLFYILPLILVVFIFWFFRKQAIENANVALVRNKKANKIARKRLRQAEKFLKENKKEEFYNEVLKALWGYLCDKLAIPQSELNKDNLEIELQKHNLRGELIASFIGILNECEFAQYALGESLQDRDKLFAETTKIIMLLEENIKK